MPACCPIWARKVTISGKNRNGAPSTPISTISGTLSALCRCRRRGSFPEALLLWLDLYPFHDLGQLSTAELKKSVAALRRTWSPTQRSRGPSGADQGGGYLQGVPPGAVHFRKPRSSERGLRPPDESREAAHGCWVTRRARSICRRCSATGSPCAATSTLPTRSWPSRSSSRR